MIIKRKQKPLYYISPNPNLEKEIVSPDLPNNFLTREKFQDNKTKRILSSALFSIEALKI